MFRLSHCKPVPTSSVSISWSGGSRRQLRRAITKIEIALLPGAVTCTGGKRAMTGLLGMEKCGGLLFQLLALFSQCSNKPYVVLFNVVPQVVNPEKI